MKILKCFLVIFLCYSALAYAEGNTFARVRYNGGSVASKVDPKDWNNKLTVTSGAITLETKDGVKVDIPAKSVTSLSYGQEAQRRVGAMDAPATQVVPAAMFHKGRVHYIGIQYSTAVGKNSGILLQGYKDNFQAILTALQGVSGAAISVADQDRGSLPGGLTAEVTKDSNEDSAAGSASQTPQGSKSNSVRIIVLTTIPDGSEIYLDDQFYGNGPATVKLEPGKHTISVKMPGYKEWNKEIAEDAGSDMHLTVTLEKAEPNGEQPCLY
jgi:hypothetical protein